MSPLHRLASAIAAALAALLLAACGGAENGGSAPAVQPQPTAAAAQPALAQEPDAPQSTGNTALDGFNWFNYRRRQLGLAPVAANAAVNAAAQAHSGYQQLNDTITHDQVAGKPGFTGAALPDRLAAAGFVFNRNPHAYGEVISATGDPAGFDAAEDLITAIYHRFVIFEPVFTEAGVGSAMVADGYTYFTTDFVANGLGPGVGPGGLVNYPAADQPRVPVIFYSDRETPDPVEDRNETGFPVSVHANITSAVEVQSFTLRPRGGAPLAVRLLSRATDANTPASVAAIIPLTVLSPQTVYDVDFSGTVNGAPLNRSWSFTTR